MRRNFFADGKNESSSEAIGIARPRRTAATVRNVVGEIVVLVLK
jgi:hypothetical protein